MAFSDTKLSPALIAELSKRNALGTGYRALEEWLLKEHNINLSYITLRKKIMLYREDNVELSKEILAEKKEQLGMAIDSDLALIQSEIDAMQVIARGCLKKDNRTRLAVTDRLVKLIDLRRKFCGIESKEEMKEDESHSDDLMSKLDDLIDRRKADKEAKHDKDLTAADDTNEDDKNAPDYYNGVKLTGAQYN